MLVEAKLRFYLSSLQFRCQPDIVRESFLVQKVAVSNWVEDQDFSTPVHQKAAALKRQLSLAILHIHRSGRSEIFSYILLSLINKEINTLVCI